MKHTRGFGTELKLDTLWSKPRKKQFSGCEKQKSLSLLMMVRLSDMLLTIRPATLWQVYVFGFSYFSVTFGGILGKSRNPKWHILYLKTQLQIYKESNCFQFQDWVRPKGLDSLSKETIPSWRSFHWQSWTCTRTVFLEEGNEPGGRTPICVLKKRKQVSKPLFLYSRKFLWRLYFGFENIGRQKNLLTLLWRSRETDKLCTSFQVNGTFCVKSFYIWR